MLHLPQTQYDWYIATIFWLGGIWTLIYEFFIVYPSYHDDPWNQPVLKYLIVFAATLASVIYTNMYLLMSQDVSTNQLCLAGGDAPLPEGWKMCSECNIAAPPRAHHCKLCNICVLKRDHHCYFAGYCIGFQNHRHFICVVFFAAIASIFCNIYNWEFYMSVKGGFGWLTLPTLVAPHIEIFGLIIGETTFYQFFITFWTSVGTLVAIVMVWLVKDQVILFMTGQVKHERKEGIFDYSIGIKHTKNVIFGSAGFSVFFNPFAKTELPGDGTFFEKKESKKEN